MDTPDTDSDTEYVQELRNKRLGLSDMVLQQIARYTDAAKRGQDIPYTEATGLGALIMRRPDATEVIESAGRLVARDLYESIPAATRRTLSTAPGFIARPLAMSKMKRFVKRYLAGDVRRNGSVVTLKVADPIPLETGPSSVGCTYYAAALRELTASLLAGWASSDVEHVRCKARGDSACEWRFTARGDSSRTKTDAAA